MDWLKPLSYFRDNLGADGKPFFTGMAHGTMTVELYKPVGRDLQMPHAQDELYIVIAGSGTFSKAGELRSFAPGDVIFVEAGLEHRFESFSEDFETWVIFWGPKGGESAAA
ncbi:cupin domain-containing protein [Labrys sp. KNU-23]|uniref:cupin domain-containing protein n=1 Tax=Labrys sp. KNU-23 TaxID=2789216 RepID=UPI0011EF5E9A|nr:cupin domain-containing protein [Labrys sp. KNU-23]QEN87574.1 cupin domain-containing protein [Labrys sp. KNU-23]